MIHLLKKVFNLTAEDEAIDIYKKQVNAIKTIKDSHGFKEIVKWWEREYTRIDNELDKVEYPEDLIAERKAVKKHLLWLYALENARIDESNPTDI
jgi:hypothetical protein